MNKMQVNTLNMEHLTGQVSGFRRPQPKSSSLGKYMFNGNNFHKSQTKSLPFGTC